jgi:plastocyanin
MLFPLAALVAACGGSDSTSPGTTTPGTGGTTTPTPTVTTAVDMSGNKFTPNSIKVAPSATLTFTNSDGYNHNVTFAGNAATVISNWATGPKTTTAPATAGTYTYSCTLHAGMNGTVQVQ